MMSKDRVDARDELLRRISAHERLEGGDMGILSVYKGKKCVMTVGFTGKEDLSPVEVQAFLYYLQRMWGGDVTFEYF